jgi:hypothetical protein
VGLKRKQELDGFFPILSGDLSRRGILVPWEVQIQHSSPRGLQYGCTYALKGGQGQVSLLILRYFPLLAAQSQMPNKTVAPQYIGGR